MSETAQNVIPANRDAVLQNLRAAAKRAGRTDVPDLVAVSKVQPDDRIAAMLAVGQKIYGENRVQEAQGRWGERFADHRDGLTLHLIGPLQTNKAEDACALFDVIETLDREKLAKALVKAADKTGRLPKLFVQVNTGQEPQKAGVLPADLPAFLARIEREYKLRPAGLMCIPPAAEAASAHFMFLRKLAAQNDVAELSMGMSGDFEVAAQLGATSVRVGSALFGARDYG